MKNLTGLILTLFLILVFESCGRSSIDEYPIKPVPFKDVVLDDNLWTGKIEKNLDVTMPYVIDQLTSKGGFNFSGTSKVLEGISYYLMVDRDPELEALADSLIANIRSMQHENGFIGKKVLNENGSIPTDSIPWLGVDDFGETGGSSFLYGFGHMYEAAAAYFEATGKTSLLDIAEKNASLLLSVFGKNNLVSYPTHPEIELALVKLYQVTGKEEYLELSRFFLDSRGPDGTEYSQSHQKIIDQTEAIGHAVRALYLYSGITDIVALTGDKAYRKAIDATWNSVVGSKLYITGGIGNYAEHEAIGPPFSLPNMTAYNETCASIANIFWSQRMFLLNGDASYIDVLERTLYNSLLSGISISGDRFFYPNPLESTGQYQRASWYGVPCCPTNIVRFLPQIPGYVYASKGDALYINLFINSSSEIDLPCGRVGIRQETDYPWEGKVKLEISPPDNGQFVLKVRIPGWAKGEPLPSDLYTYINKPQGDVEITINGVNLKYENEKGYAIIDRTWSAGDIVEFTLPMDVFKIKSNDKVLDDNGRIALQRGPIVYCIEGPDNKGGHVSNIVIPLEASFVTEEVDDLFNGTLTLTTDGYGCADQQNNKEMKKTLQEVTAIPYYLWANRGPAEMSVWIPYEYSVVNPLPNLLPTLASESTILSSFDTTTLSGINDRFIIPYNQNIPISSYYRWPMDDTIQWVQYVFNKPESVSSTSVYWYDNEPSRMTTWYDDSPWTCCRVPESWELFYLDNNETWKPVVAINEYGTERYVYNELKFEPVTTSSLRMVVQRHKTCASGLQEWVIN